MSRILKPSRFLSFPYKFLQSELGRIPYPVLPVALHRLGQVFRYEFIVDTGADTTTLPHYVAKKLKIDLRTLPRSKSQGIGNKPSSTWESELILEIAGIKVKTHCFFVASNKIPPLLGKLDIFDKFNFYFDNDQDKLVLEIRK